MTVSAVRDKTPNEALIKYLEDVLKDARAGELRSMIAVFGWDDDSVTHGWVYDDRNSTRRLFAEVVLLQHDFTVNIEMLENDTVLARAFDKL